MQRNARIERKALQAVRNHFCAQVSNLLALEAGGKVRDEVRPVGEVDDRAGQCLVQRRVCGSKACEAGGRRKRSLESAAEGEEGVFCRVVVVDYKPLATP
jgi:hypothetical protein